LQSDDSSTFSFSEFTSQNSQGSAKLLLQQVMGVSAPSTHLVKIQKVLDLFFLTWARS
jgi:hypothetical protein